MGLLVAALPSNGTPQRETLRAALLIGVLGGYTTFSSFGRETIDLIAAHRAGWAALYILASNAAGLAAVWIGMLAAKRLV
jgi:fluoride exporter